MTYQVTWGPSSALAGYTGIPRQMVLDSDLQQLRVMDGITPGGVPHARASQVSGEITYDMTVDADYALTNEQSMHYRIIITDSTALLTTGRTITLPQRAANHLIKNGTSQTLTITSGGDTVAISAGGQAVVYCDGINCTITDADLIAHLDNAEIHLTSTLYGYLTGFGAQINQLKENGSPKFNAVQTDAISEKTADAGVTIEGVVIKDGGADMGGQKITSLATPSAATDAATKGYVDTRTITHNSTEGLQGGTTDEYYHITNAVHSALTDPNAQLSELHKDGVAQLLALGLGTENPQDTLDLGSGTSGKAIVWGGSSGTALFGSVGTLYSSGDLGTFSGLQLSKTVGEPVEYSRTATYGVSSMQHDYSTGEIKFFTEPPASHTKGDPYSGTLRLKIGSSGQVSMFAGADMGGQKITSLATPSAATDAATKGYVDTRTITHNSTEGLQGGTTDEYYHITNAVHSALTDPNAQLSELHKDGVAQLLALGLGTENPQDALDLGSGTSGKAIVWGGGSGTALFGSVGTLYGSGDLGTFSGLQLSKTVSEQIEYARTATYGVSSMQHDYSTGEIKFFTEPPASHTKGDPYSGTPRLKIGSSGQVYLFGLGSGAAYNDVQLTASNELIKIVSSRRYKTDIEDYTVEEEKILGLSLRKFTYLPEYGGENTIGLVAEEVAEVCDDLVNYALFLKNTEEKLEIVDGKICKKEEGKAGDTEIKYTEVQSHEVEKKPDSVKYSLLALLQLSVIQKLIRKIEAQKKNLEEMKVRNNALEQRLNSLETRLSALEPA